jgi:hypothetical protein
MSVPAPKATQLPSTDPLEVTEADNDSVLYEAKGDPREAIRMLLHDLATMAMDGDAASSRGFLAAGSPRATGGRLGLARGMVVTSMNEGRCTLFYDRGADESRLTGWIPRR